MYIHKKLFLTRCIALWVILALMVTLIPTAPYAVGQEEKKPDGGGTTDTPQEAPEQQAEAPPERVSDGDEEEEEPAEQEESEDEETPAPTLSGLTVSDTDLNEPFDPAVTTYTADVAHNSETVTISATPTDETATVAFTDTTDADTDTVGQQVNLTEGENTITITVTAEDAVATQTYTLTVTRAAEEEEEQEEANENEEQEDEEEAGEETPEEREEETAGGDDEEEQEEEETLEPIAEPAPEQPQAQQQQQAQLPDDDTADTQAAPTGKLGVKLKYDATDDTGTLEDSVTSNTAPTLAVTSTTNSFFGGDNDTVEVYYKNSACATGSAVPTTAFDASGTAPSGWTRYGASTGAQALSTLIYVSAGTTTLTAGTYCFFVAHTAAGTTTTLSSHSVGYEAIIDNTAPVLTAFKIGTGSTATYAVTATDNMPLTGKTKDNVAAGSCTDTTTTDSTWTDYVRGTNTGTAHDTNGRCVIFSDVAGNKKAQHLLDSASVTALTTPTAPVGFTAAWNAAGVTLNWTGPTGSTVTGYQTQQCDGDGNTCGSWTDISGSSATTVSHAVTALSANTAYTVKLRASNTNGGGFEVVAVGTTGTVYDTDGDGLIDINTIEKLNAMRWDLNGNGVVSSADEGTNWTSGNDTKYTAVFPTAATYLGCPGPCVGYELTADLDLDDNDAGDRTDDTFYNSGSGWEPIGPSYINSYAATFNGNGFMIDNLFINRAINGVGFFNYLTGTVTAVGLRDADVSSDGRIGILVGQSYGTVTASFATGSVSGANIVGGLVGGMHGTSSVVQASYTNVTVSGTADNLGVGGLVGSNHGGDIINSYAYGAASSRNPTTTHLGGLVGGTHGRSTVTASYHDSTVTSSDGYNTPATGKTTAQLQSPTGYTGIFSAWDDSDLDGDGNNDTPWDFGSNTQYPILSFGGHRVATQRDSAGNLSALTISAGALSPTFNAYRYLYDVEIPAATTTVTVTPTVFTSGASVTVNGSTVTSGSPSAAITLAAVGTATTITIVVTPSSGDPQTYTISATRKNDYDDDDDGLIDIRTHQQLNAVRWDLDGDGMPAAVGEIDHRAAFSHAMAGMGCTTACTGYELRADIDVDTDGDNDGTWTGDEASPTGDSGDMYYNGGSGWLPIGTATNSFRATFKGNGYTIANLFINRSTTNDAGLFGHVGVPSNSHTRIEGVGLKNAYVRGADRTGALVGNSEKPVTASWVSGVVRGGAQVGGLIGLSEGEVTASYSLASVTATNKGGGLIGEQDGDTITASYAIGNVSVSGATEGGLVATATNTPTETNTYYNSETTTLSASALGTAKTSAQLTAPTGYTGIYANWNVDVGGTSAADDPWSIAAGRYPVLKYGAGADTAQQAAEQLPAAPQGLTAVAGNTEITVSWTNPNDPTITKYQYKRKVGTGNYDASWTDIPGVGATGTSYTFTGLTNGTVYQYKIRAVNAAGNSAEAETTAATPAIATSAAPASVTLARDADAIDPYTGTGTHRTRDTTPTISFTAVSGATTTVQYRQGASGAFSATGVTHTGTGSDTSRTATLPALSTNGTYQVEITQTESGKAAQKSTYDFMLDTEAPTVNAGFIKNNVNASGGVDYFGVDGVLIVSFTFNEDIAASQTITGKFVNDAADIPASGGSHHAISVNRINATKQTLTLSVRDEGPDVAVDDLKYQITNGTALTDLAGNALGAQSVTGIANVAIDTTKPTLTPTKVGTGNAATYKVSATDNSPPLAGRTKDNVAVANCTDNAVTTTAAGWSGYTPGTNAGTADDTNGRCVVITDVAGNSKAQHLSDGDNAITADFTLDITGNGTANYLDAIVHYYYAQNPNDQPTGGAVMANFINANDFPVKTGSPITTADIYTTMQNSAATRDFTGNGTANYLDAIVHYYYAQNPNDQPTGGAVMANFINANDFPVKTGSPTTTAAIYTLLQGL